AYNAVGNHEFDHGSAELLRLQYGGCHPTDGCFTDAGFQGADFEYLAANVEVSPGQTIFPRYAIKNVEGMQIAFIGMTLEGTPQIVSPGGVAGLTFENEVATVNALVPELKQKDVNAIVVLIHQGGFQTGTYDECPGLSGDILPIINGLDPAVDVIVSAHTHQAYNCTIDGRIVTSAASFGRLVTKIDLTFDRHTRKLVTKAAKNVIVTRDVPPDPVVQSIIQQYAELAAPLANRVVGHSAHAISKVQGANGESVLGQIIADSQLE